MITSQKDAQGRAHWPDCNQGSAKYYAVDWTDYLTNENDTLQTVTWVLPAGLTSMDEQIVGGEARIKIQANTIGKHQVECQMNSVEGSDTQLQIQVMNLRVR